MVDKGSPQYHSVPVPAVLHNAVVLYRRAITFSYIVSTNHKFSYTVSTNHRSPRGCASSLMLGSEDEEDIRGGGGVAGAGGASSARGRYGGSTKDRDKDKDKQAGP